MTLERGQKLKQRGAVVSAIPDHARLRLAIKRNDVAEANRMLLSLPFGAIETFGVIEAWMYAREEQLQTAEMRLASLIIDFCPNQPFLLLHAVNSFMGQGMARNAAILLQDIVSRFGIRDQMQAGHIANFAAALDLPLLREQAQENLRRAG